jgi:hypothetical protein
MPLVFFTSIGDVTFPFPIGGPGSSLTQTRDPLVTDDITKGVEVGTIWFNSTAGALRLWTCRSNIAGAAAWIFEGADYKNGGTNPAIEITQFGNGAALMAEEGNINRQISAAGINPGATGADNVLAFFSLPANSFDGAAGTNRGINITAEGSFAATANNKDVKLIFNPATAVVGSTVGAGGTTIADTGVVATNNLGWSLQANVFKYGAAGSNTQIGLHQQAQIGNAVANLLKPSLITAVENAPILIAVTGNATTAASDIVFNFLEVNAMN